MLWLTLLCSSMQVGVTVIVIVLFALICPVYPQARKAFTINEISELMKSGVSPNRVAGLIDQYGVAFELDQRTLQRLKQDGANEAVLSAVKRMSARYTEERQLKIKEQEEANKRQQQEEEKRKEQERNRADEEKRRQAEVARKKQQEAQQRAEEIKQRQQEEARRKEEDLRKAEEQKRQQPEADTASKAREQRRQEQARLFEKKRRVEEEARGAAPSCVVGQKLQFRYDNARSFVREITAHENNLCVVKSVNTTYYFDKDWALVKLVDSKGQTFESATPMHREIGEKWLPFPLTVSKQWETQYQGFSSNTGLITSYQNHFTVLAFEEITVPAGTFKAFKIKQTQTPVGTRRWGVRYFWYAPEIGFYVKRQGAPKESVDPSYWQTVRDYELVSISPAK